VAVHGCGVMGPSAIIIAFSMGAHVIIVNVANKKLAFAKDFGTAHLINAAKVDRVAQAVREATGGGAHLSIDALGSPQTCFNSISCLRRRGRHLQLGFLFGEDKSPLVLMSRVVAHELEVRGRHGMQAHRYGSMMDMI
jgi:alcohol dehydrogenase